jgi:TDG/mug DNA glycosylase family protein
MRVEGFSPIAAPGATVLILGSMPGVASLRAQQYYGHPRNAFWPIIGELYGFSAQAPYASRVQALMQAGVAVWDVLQYCVRPGSLDSAILPTSVVPNDFSTFFDSHPGIKRVCFNGAGAAALFRRHVAPGLAFVPPRGYLTLPSTSPAHAAMSLARKLDAWRALR